MTAVVIAFRQVEELCHWIQRGCSKLLVSVDPYEVEYHVQICRKASDDQEVPEWDIVEALILTHKRPIRI